MAYSVDSPSPSHLSKEATGLMGSSTLISPSSDKRFWSVLSNRVDSLLDERQNKVVTISDELNLDPFQVSIGGSNRAKRMKEDSLLLLRGFDSIACTLSQLSNNLDNALQGARTLAAPPTLNQIFHFNIKSSETKQDDSEKQQSEENEEKKNTGLKRKFDSSDAGVDQGNDPQKENEQSSKDRKLIKAKNVDFSFLYALAISLASKAASLSRELKSIKSDLCFMQERSAMLEEENRRLRDGYSKGIRSEEDDLMRLQMEALLAEKSRLANENANLTRENQCLQQLVEYHQVTTQDLSASYEQFISGICLDFSSPAEEAQNAENEGLAEAPRTNLFDFSTSLDEFLK
ncbi:hypothetical protein K2173_018288 [Erythroxylum novogranatense]|uniref:Uncharacterized protein n=1 Tax=Erythroxylum novogranatense TaxID=1862640 RepID=A0AAV8UA07_9ROSI|nr:hypothetical protein K2173_018288 [Erythroxylum novogranatense]